MINVLKMALTLRRSLFHAPLLLTESPGPYVPDQRGITRCLMEKEPTNAANLGNAKSETSNEGQSTKIAPNLASSVRLTFQSDFSFGTLDKIQRILVAAYCSKSSAFAKDIDEQ